MGSLPVLSLFCGAGGLDLGFEDVGFAPLLAIDKSSAAVETYNQNRHLGISPGKIGDLSAIDVSQVHSWWEKNAGKGVRPVGIIGGPPCQAFSVGNARKLQDDPRARLPLAYARVLEYFNTRFKLDFFVFENVAGLGKQLHESSLRSFLDAFCAAGFEVTTFYLDAVRFGVPQHRQRLFVVGFRSGSFDVSKFEPPNGNGIEVTVRQAIENLPEPVYFSKHRKPAQEGLHPNHWCMNPRSPKFKRGLSTPKVKGRSFRRLAWDDPSWTVAYGHREVHVHPSGTRRLSIYEAMLLQGFPRQYELIGNLSQQVELVSDAVPPPLARALAMRIREFITSDTVDQPLGKAQPGSNGQLWQLGFEGLQTTAPRSTKP